MVDTFPGWRIDEEVNIEKIEKFSISWEIRFYPKRKMSDEPQGDIIYIYLY